MPPVFLYQQILPPYRIPAWARLAEALDDRLVVIFGRPPGRRGPEHPRDLPFRFLEVENRWHLGGALLTQAWREPFQRLGRPGAILSSQSPRVISLFPLLAHAHRQGVPVVLRGHGGSRRRPVTSLHPADLVHRWLVRQADAYVCYTDESRATLTGITDPDKLFVGRNTLDVEHLARLRRELEGEGKEEVRHRLGLTGSRRYLVYIGRLTREKRVGRLLEALSLMQERGASLGLTVVGDGPLRERLEARTDDLELRDVRFTGALTAWEASAGWLFASDALVIPGAVGLAVNHALAFGLPVLTVKRARRGPFHGPEVAFVRPGETGAFAPSDDPQALADAATALLEKAHELQESCIRFAEERLSLDAMVRGHLDALKHAGGL